MADAIKAAALSQVYKDAVRNITERPSVPRAQKSLLLNGKYADMVMSCGGKHWLAHRVIMGIQSAVFADAIDECLRVRLDSPLLENEKKADSSLGEPTRGHSPLR
jgi:hypothetical protein